MSLWQQSHGSGPDLVLLHGWGLNSSIWTGLLELLTPHFRVHCIDLPGFGRSAAREHYSWERVIEQLAEVIPEQALVLGWSLGGLVAQALSLRLSARIKGLILVASSPCFSQRSDWLCAMKPEVLAGFAAQLQHDFRRTLEQFLALQAIGSPSVKEDVRYLKSVVLEHGKADPHALSAGLDWLAEVDLRPQLAELTIPSLWIFGRLDVLVPQACSQSLSHYLPSAQIQLMPQASHAPFLSHPQEFCQLVRAFAAEMPK